MNNINSLQNIIKSMDYNRRSGKQSEESQGTYGKNIGGGKIRFQNSKNQKANIQVQRRKDSSKKYSKPIPRLPSFDTF